MSVITKGFSRGGTVLVKGFGSVGLMDYIIKVMHLVSTITRTLILHSKKGGSWT